MSENSISIGPAGSQWVYEPSSTSYDMTRGSSRRLSIKTSRGDEVTSLSVEPDKSALIVVDMQNFFLHPRCKENVLGLKTVSPLLKVIEKCRDINVQVYCCLYL